MPKAANTLTPRTVPLLSGKTALAMLEINDQLAKLGPCTPADHPDAALIRLCVEHPEKLKAFEDDPLDSNVSPR